jgi:hypothetical protein
MGKSPRGKAIAHQGLSSGAILVKQSTENPWKRGSGCCIKCWGRWVQRVAHGGVRCMENFPSKLEKSPRGTRITHHRLNSRSILVRQSTGNPSRRHPGCSIKYWSRWDQRVARGVLRCMENFPPNVKKLAQGD